MHVIVALAPYERHVMSCTITQIRFVSEIINNNFRHTHIILSQVPIFYFIFYSYGEIQSNDGYIAALYWRRAHVLNYISKCSNTRASIERAYAHVCDTLSGDFSTTVFHLRFRLSSHLVFVWILASLKRIFMLL